MKCYNHPDTDAVGTCKSCCKGICHACLTDTGNGIACTATCVEEVNSINKLIENNRDIHNKAAATGTRNAMIYFVFAVVCIFIAFTEKQIAVFILIIGLFFIVGGIQMLARAIKNKKQ